MEKQLRLVISVFSTIQEQIDEGGFKHDPKVIKQFDNIRKSFLMLKINGYLHQNEIDRIGLKITKKVAAHLSEFF